MLIRSRAWGFIRAGLNNHYGVRLADAPTGGDFPPLISYVGVWTEPQDAATEVVFVPETLPLQGDFELRADSSYIHGPITGSDPWTCRVYYVEPGEDAQEATGSPATITDSGGDDGTVSASGATLRAAARFSGGGATAAVSATGAALRAAARFSGGGATAGGAVAASGATLRAVARFVGGGAVASAAASAAGVTLRAAARFTGGGARLPGANVSPRKLRINLRIGLGL